MPLYDKYFLVTLLTIVFTRGFVYLWNKPSPTIKNFRTHHWMYGLLFTFLLFCIANFYTNIYKSYESFIILYFSYFFRFKESYSN